MRVFIAVIILIFSLQSFTKADDISDFQIGNFTLDESLLNYYEKDYLMSNWNDQKHTYDFKSKKYYKFVFFESKFRPYDQIVLYTLKTDKLFKIKSITGFRENMDIKNCYEEQISISAEISKLFPNNNRETYGPVKKASDPTGNSTEKGIYFVFDNGGAAGTACIDYGNEYIKKYPYTNDHMQVYLDTKQYSDWLRNEAWN